MKKIIYSCLLLNFISNQFFCDSNKKDIVGLDGRNGVYNSDTKTAFLIEDGDKTVYTNIVEYSQAVTPPNIENRKMIAFATMQNDHYSTLTRGRAGGQRKKITLYGIPQDSVRINQASFEIMNEMKPEENAVKIFGAKGYYNSKTKTAYLIDAQGKRTEYTNIVEYSQSVTPPNVENKKMIAFATMPNPRYASGEDKIAGGQFKNAILYGIKKKHK